MLARMIAYYIDMNFKKCKYALDVGYHGTKSRMTTSVVVTETQRRAPSEGVVVSSDHSTV